MDFQLRSHAPSFSNIQSNLRGGAAILFGGTMLGNAVAYAYHMIMARMMTPADYGVLVTLTSISYVLAVLMRTFQAWVIKAVTVTQGTRAGHVRTVFIVAMRTLVPLGVIVLVGHWLVGQWVADFLHLGTTTPVILLGLYTFSTFLIPIPRGMLLGLNRLYLAGVIHVLEPATRLVAGTALVVWGLKVNGALTGYAIGNFAAFAIAVGLLWPVLRHRVQTPLALGLDGLERYALLVLLINAFLMLMASVDQIAVKHFFSEEVAGNYAVAFLLGRIIAMSAIALGWVIFARSASMASNDPRRVRLLVKGLFVAGFIAVTLTTGYLVAPALAVRLMGGTQYGIADAYVGLVGIEMTLFAFVYVQVYYHISMKQMQVVWPLGFATALKIFLLTQYHATVQQILLILIFVMGGVLIYVSGLSWWVLRARGPVTSVVATPQITLSGEQ